MTAGNDRPVKTPREWLRYAEGDLLVAEHEMQQAGLDHWEMVCSAYPTGRPRENPPSWLTEPTFCGLMTFLPR